MAHCNDTQCNATSSYDDADERVCNCSCSTCEAPVVRRKQANRSSQLPRPERTTEPIRSHAVAAPLSPTAGWLVMALVFGGGYWFYRSCADSWEESKNSAYGRKVGDRVRLYFANEPESEVPSASDPEVFARFVKTISNNDKVAQSEIAPRIWYIAPKTEAVILSVVDGGFLVRFTSGPRAGERAHVHWATVQDPPL